MSKMTPVSLPQQPATMQSFLTAAGKRFPDLRRQLPGLSRLEKAAESGVFPDDPVELLVMRRAWGQLQEMLAGGRLAQVTQDAVTPMLRSNSLHDTEAPEPSESVETLNAGEQSCGALALCQSFVRDGHPLMQDNMVSTHVTERMAQLMRINRREFDPRTVKALTHRIHHEDLIRLKGLLDPLPPAKQALFRRSMELLLPNAKELAAERGDEASATLLEYYRSRIVRISDKDEPTEIDIEVLRKAHARLHVRMFRLLIPYDTPSTPAEEQSAREITQVPLPETRPEYKGNGGGSGAVSTSIFNMNLEDAESLAVDAGSLGATWFAGAPMSFVSSTMPLIRL